MHDGERSGCPILVTDDLKGNVNEKKKSGKHAIHDF